MWSQWYLIEDAGKKVIRRYQRKNGKTQWQRLPAQQYRDLNQGELESLLRRLNVTKELERREAEERYNFDHAYVNQRSLQMFDDLLYSSANNKKHINRMAVYLRLYVLDFFITKCKVPDPKFWKKHENEWGLWLEKKLAYNTIKQVIFNANRFLALLHEKCYPNEVPLIKLKPLSRNKLKLLKATTSKSTYKFIDEQTFKTIVKNAELSGHDDAASVMKLCYYFGLRISEALGLQHDDVYEKSLKVYRQASNYVDGRVITKELKDIDGREVPYWYSTPDEAYELIGKLPKSHPNTAMKKVNLLIKRFGNVSHDFRRSFATRALQQHHWKLVKDAMGHEDIETTMGYDIAEKSSSNKKWKPSK